MAEVVVAMAQMVATPVVAVASVVGMTMAQTVAADAAIAAPAALVT